MKTIISADFFEASLMPDGSVGIGYENIKYAPMIQASELRKGNFVRVKDYILCVKGISETLALGNNSTSDFIHDNFNYSDVAPIPLTPELLGKCGFEKGNAGFWFKAGVEYNPETFTLEGFGYCEIKHLHQLQNLYFALTGEELEVNL